MSDSRNDSNGSKKEGESKRRRGGLPAVLMFLGVLFGLVLLIESFSGPQTTRVPHDKLLWQLYTGSITNFTRKGETRLEGKYVEIDDEGRRSSPVVSFACELSKAELDRLGPELQELISPAPTPISEESIVAKLAGDGIDPKKAWVASLHDEFGNSIGTKDRLFVEVFEGSRGFIRYQVTSSARAGAPMVNVPRVQQALGRFDVKIERRGVPSVSGAYKYEPDNPLLMTLLVNFLPWLLIIGVLWFFIFRQFRAAGGAGGVLSFGRARPNLVGKERTGVTFDDVAGIDEAKEEVKEIVEFLKDPARFSRIGARIPRGVLLVGSPGTGKTLLAKAIAGEADVPFFSISGSDFVEMFVGVGASRVRDLFRQAREKQRSLIFLDEIDAVGRRRGSGLGGGHDEREQTLNAILVEMDGFETDEGIILIAATNRPDVLDPALLRPGRFDRQVVIDLPDVKGREAILKVHTRHVPIDGDVELSKVARATPGFSGAELASLVNEAALRATLLNRDRVNMADFEEARDRVRFGREKNRRVLDEKERRVTAYHEAGHALVGCLHPGVEPLHKVTIIPRGLSLGATMILPEKDRHQQRREQMLGMICFAFGGRLAEEIFCGDVTSGAYDDIRKATEIARSMVTLFGMSDKLGPINLAEREESHYLGGETSRSRAFSEETAKLIDSEVKRIVDDCYATARGLIESHKPQLEVLAEALLKYETIHAEEIIAIVAGASVEEAHSRFERSHPLPQPSKPKPPRAEPGAEPHRSPIARPEEGLPPAGEPVAP